MKISNLKQHFKLIAEEVNVKNVIADIANSEKGVISINYALKENILYFIINNKRVDSVKLNEA